MHVFFPFFTVHGYGVFLLLSAVLFHSAIPRYTQEWVIHVNSVSDAKAVARRLGFQYHSQVLGQDDMHVVLRPEAVNPHAPCHFHTNRLQRHHHVKWAGQQVIRKRRRKDLFSSSLVPPTNLLWTDPGYPRMWYLTRGRQSGGRSMDINVQEAWALGFSGKGVVVSILDDGIEYTHPDLKDNYDPLASTDLNGNDADPMPNRNNLINKHGTRCAGEVAAAGNNSVCMVGIAFRARVGGVRMLDGDVTDRIEASALGLRQDHVHIYSGSWGPDDNGKSLEGPGVLAARALENGITLGRGGLGNIYVWASGNGGAVDDSCAADGYASSMYTISVSSTSERNTRPWYLESCSSTIVSTYSSGAQGERQILTVDLFNKCTDGHTGTSASAPLVAGAVALALEANPKLTWRDVQYLTILTANPKPFVDGNFQPNSAGYFYSPMYGFGMLDAGKMVRLAQMWRTLPEHHKCDSGPIPLDMFLRGSFSVVLPVESSGCRESSTPKSRVEYVEHVQLYLGLNSSYRGELQIELVSPGGTRSVMLPSRRNDNVGGNTQLDKWPLMSVQFWGETTVTGVWTLHITNQRGIFGPKNSSLVVGSVLWARLLIYGTDDRPISLTQPPKSPSPNLEPDPNWLSRWQPYLESEEEYHNRVKCHSACATCRSQPAGVVECLSCRQGHLFIPSLKRCVASSCPRSFHQADDRNCLPCLTHCVKCDSRHCVQCEPGYNVAANGTCVSSCPSGTFADPQKRCQPCHPSCATCFLSNSARHCMSCAQTSGPATADGNVPRSRHFLPTQVTPSTSPQHDNSHTLGQCVLGCPLGLFYHQKSDQCKWCPANCSRCNLSESAIPNVPEVLTCLDCEHPFRRASDGSCVDPVNLVCSPGFYRTDDLSKCEPCHASCKECFGAGANQCLSCNSSVLVGHSCVSVCPPGFYSTLPREEHNTTTQRSRGKVSLLSRQCLPCHPACANCAGPSPQHCGNCSVDYHWDMNTTECRRNHSSSKSLVCSREGHFMWRHVPSSGLSTSNYSCVTSCPGEGFYANEVTHLCLPCPASCRSCEEGSGHCSSCYLGWTLDSLGFCQRGPQCRVDQALNATTQRCENCPAGCSRCSTIQPEACDRCSRKWCRFSGQSSKCFPCCEEGKSTTSQCQPCILGSELCAPWFHSQPWYRRHLLWIVLCALLLFGVSVGVLAVRRWQNKRLESSSKFPVRYQLLTPKDDEAGTGEESDGVDEDVLYHRRLLNGHDKSGAMSNGNHRHRMVVPAGSSANGVKMTGDEELDLALG